MEFPENGRVTARQFKLGFTLHKRSRSGVELNVVIGNEMDLP